MTPAVDELILFNIVVMESDAALYENDCPLMVKAPVPLIAVDNRESCRATSVRVTPRFPVEVAVNGPDPVTCAASILVAVRKLLESPPLPSCSGDAEESWSLFGRPSLSLTIEAVTPATVELIRLATSVSESTAASIVTDVPLMLNVPLVGVKLKPASVNIED